MRNLMDLAELDKTMPERSAVNNQQIVVLIKTVYNDRFHRSRSGARQHDHFSVLITVRQFFQTVHTIENHVREFLIPEIRNLAAADRKSLFIHFNGSHRI